MYGLCWKSMRSLGLTSMLVAAFAAPLTVSASTDVPAAPQSAASVPSDADLAAVISSGKNKMPAYAKQLKPEEIAELAAYSRALGKK